MKSKKGYQLKIMEIEEKISPRLTLLLLLSYIVKRLSIVGDIFRITTNRREYIDTTKTNDTSTPLVFFITPATSISIQYNEVDIVAYVRFVHQTCGKNSKNRI